MKRNPITWLPSQMPRIEILPLIAMLALQGCGPNAQEKYGFTDAQWLYYEKCRGNLLKLGITQGIDEGCAIEAKAE
ncbi:hypothetical protein [Sedimenticola hydrogenitrophicus]|uniref:hypothetical protein n=1 Tax=Sedimenticola hydrogenitrophicus TaxID=2967975 RepID=UPI0023AF1651|nr:hypothetical protein [Sedimenticola hydrogenitrophicus]